MCKPSGLVIQCFQSRSGGRQAYSSSNDRLAGSLLQSHDRKIVQLCRTLANLRASPACRSRSRPEEAFSAAMMLSCARRRLGKPRGRRLSAPTKWLQRLSVQCWSGLEWTRSPTAAERFCLAYHWIRKFFAPTANSKF